METSIALGFLIPFLGTVLGAATVFLFRKEISDRTQKAMLGFASGVMVAASFWSLLQPAIEMSMKDGDAMGNSPYLEALSQAWDFCCCSTQSSPTSI